MSGKGGLSHKHYWETKGLKIGDGQLVKAGTIVTRQGDKWKPGINVGGVSSLFALSTGRVYFTKRKGKYNKLLTFINIKPAK